MSPVGENYRRIRDRIGEAAARSRRDPNRIRFIGVTKKVDAERVREAIDCGLTDIGENRVQEAEQKIPLLNSPHVTCHLIGHLQGNKARKAANLFQYIQSVDSLSLAHRLDTVATRPLNVLIQVRLENEPSKTGILESSLQALVEAIRGSNNLSLKGLMAIPPLADSPEASRRYFRRLSEHAAAFGLPEVSMGMSHDFEIAIEEGATMIRVGTALFGERA